MDVPDLIIDGVIGYSLSGAPNGRAAELIQIANESSAAVLSLDTPSGVDTASGRVFDPSTTATATFTLALPEAGLFAEQTSPLIGELYLGDISVPPSLYTLLGLNVSPQLFSISDIVRLI